MESIKVSKSDGCDMTIIPTKNKTFLCLEYNQYILDEENTSNVKKIKKTVAVGFNKIKLRKLINELEKIHLSMNQNRKSSFEKKLNL